MDSIFTNIPNTTVTILHTRPLNWEPAEQSLCGGYNPGSVGWETRVSISSRKTVVVKPPPAEPPTHTDTQTYAQIVLFCCTTTTFTQVWSYDRAGGVLSGFGINSEKLCFTIGATRLTALRHGEGGKAAGGSDSHTASSDGGPTITFSVTMRTLGGGGGINKKGSGNNW